LEEELKNWEKRRENRKKFKKFKKANWL